MLPSQVQSIFNETTEKTIEVNFLLELVRLLSPTFIITVLGPNLRQEKALGFDDILAGLPPGYTFALQFKKPFSRGDGHPRFTLNTSQFQVLLHRFNHNEAFFVLTPFTRTQDFIAAHRIGTLLQDSTLIDVYDIPFPSKQTQYTRTLKYLGPRQVQITDPREYLPIKKMWSVKELTAAIREEKVGRKEPREKKEVPEERKKRYGGRNYYIHVAHSTN